MSDKPAIGFIGIGIMGKPMARNLIKAGYPVVALNRSRPSMDELARDGATLATSPKDVAARSDVIITMLPDSPDVEAAVNGADGILAGLRPGATWIDMSTIAPATAKATAAAVVARGGKALDAPVSGGEKGAVEGTLSIMVGGEESTFDAMLPILRSMGKNIVFVGPSGAGQTTKACNQLVVAATIEAVAEALALAEASGVDPAKVRSALLGGFAHSRILEVHGERMLAKNFTPGFKAKLHLKDLRIVDATAADRHVDLPLAKLALERMAMLASRDGEIDHSALRTLIETKTLTTN